MINLENINKDLNKNSSGIYMITCLVNNKIYIGQSKKIAGRWARHRSDLRKGKHGNPILQNCYNKYGLNSLAFTVIENCLENITEREAFYASQVETGFLMNCNKITEVIPISEETRIRIGESSRGRKHSEESKRKMSNTMKSLVTDEFREISGTAFKGKKHSEESKKKMSEGHKGKKWTEESRKKLSESKKGRKWTEKQREKIMMARRRK